MQIGAEANGRDAGRFETESQAGIRPDGNPRNRLGSIAPPESSPMNLRGGQQMDFGKNNARRKIWNIRLLIRNDQRRRCPATTITWHPSRKNSWKAL